MRDLAYWVAFSRVRGIGPVRFRRLVEVFGGARVAWEAPERALIDLIGPKLARTMVQERDRIDPARTLAGIHEHGIEILTSECERFPSLLRHISQPPCLLYLRGDVGCIESGLPLAVVGTRRPTPYGRKVTREFCRELGRNETVIISGLAAGIDGEAHRGVLESGGKTVAVLGTGLNVVYPAAHVGLVKAIVEGGGAVISEYPPDTGPRKEHFPARNRLVSGMSRGVLVVEAPRRSGALITAEFALEQGRDVMAVPGPVTSLQSEGTNHLIAQGALCVQRVEDILAFYQLQDQSLPEQLKPQDAAELSPEEEELLSRIEHSGTSKGELLERSGMGGGTFFRILIELELKGLIREEPGGVLFRL